MTKRPQGQEGASFCFHRDDWNSGGNRRLQIRDLKSSMRDGKTVLGHSNKGGIPMAKKKVKITCSRCGKDVFGFKEGGGITVKYKDRVLRIEPGGNVTFVCRICGAMTVVNLEEDSSEENQEL